MTTTSTGIDRPKGDRFLRSFIDTDKGTVSRELYVNPDVFQQELEQIFARCWLFIGHESQLRNPGDFFISRMGTEEVLVVRDRKDKQIRVFLNSCRHRGEKVCRYDQGNAIVFTCPFHAWTYDSQGRLVGAAGQAEARSYNGELQKEEWGLVQVGQLKNFHGMLWATWDKKAPSFEDYLGPWAESVRYMAEASDGTDGAEGLQVFTPFQKWRLPTNWKIPAFTSATDLEHAAMTHRSVNAAAIGPMRGHGDEGNRSTIRNLNASQRYCVGDHWLGHGGNWTEWSEPGIPPYKDTWYEPGVDDFLRAQHEKKAEKYKETIMPPHGAGGGHFCVFPNFIMDGWRWRYWHPHETGVVERWSLFTVDKEAPKHVKDAVRHYAMRYNGPSGATESDDMENWNYVFPASRGVTARQYNYSFTDGFGRGVEREGYRGGLVFNGTHTEESHRARFSRWLAFMEAKSWDDLYPVNKIANHRIW